MLTGLIAGSICISPSAATGITGFALTLSSDGTYSTSSQITGLSDMGTAYNDASGRVNPDHTNLASGAIGGLILTPGLYKWTSAVSIGSSVTILGLPTDTWIFQITGGSNIAHAQAVILAGGASPANIVWVVAGAVTLGTNSVFEGIILGGSSITMQTSSSITGRLFAQTAVALQVATVTQP
ncbi:hypothetical protein FIBSPDRAFT_872802 [Athelia psychrophila]|uniref:Antifreeze protein n=1 Tax=Athelia psychrophila TaxID=1759441 RepID=A0A165Z7K7_9AGAM|nr:hypothetical protein FIBSPDRAFT_872802 [Fibularhizoctonia sp. CBS 109695]